MIDFSLRLQLSPNSQTSTPGELLGASAGLGPPPEYWAPKQFDLLGPNALRPTFWEQTVLAKVIPARHLTHFNEKRSESFKITFLDAAEKHSLPEKP